MNNSTKRVLAKMARREKSKNHVYNKGVNQVIKSHSDKVTVIETKEPRFTQTIKSRVKSSYHDKVYSAMSRVKDSK
jgi:hypothetical protein